MLALGEGGAVLHVGDAAAQTRAVLEVIKATLEAAGASLEDVAMNHIFLKDLADFTVVNQIYGGYFRKDPPARSTVEVSHLPRNAKVEIEVIVAL